MYRIANRSSTVLVLVLMLALAGCGGQSDDTAVAQQTPLALRAVIPPLIDDQGQPMPSISQAEPPDFGARTRSGRYATAQQAEFLEAALAEQVLRVDVECCGIEGADLAVLVAWGLQAAHNLDRHAPVLVRGSDQRLAASVVNRLGEEGYTRVWLVTN